jgi:hypothetical protein
MKYQNRRVEAQELALARKHDVVERLRLATSREEIDAAMGEMLAAKEQELEAEKLPAAEFLCGGCGQVGKSLAREVITIVGYAKKDAAGEVVAMESFDPARHITICSDCAATCSLGEYLHFEKFPTPTQLKKFRGEVPAAKAKVKT